MPTVTLITPTRDRPEAFGLCAAWMNRQTYNRTVQWIIVDDGDKPVESMILDHFKRKPGWALDYLRRPVSPDACTLQDNLMAAIDRVAGDAVVIIEDDEHYAPIYVEEMVWRLREADLVGETKARYYNVCERRWGIMGENTKHASLCRTGFRAALLPAFKTIVEVAQKNRDPFIDIRLWKGAPIVPKKPASIVPPQDPNRPWARPFASSAAAPAMPQSVLNEPSYLPTGSKAVLFENRGISVGIKGMPGRGGIGRAHGTKAFKNADPTWAKLIEWIGSDAEAYMELGRELGWVPIP